MNSPAASLSILIAYILSMLCIGLSQWSRVKKRIAFACVAATCLASMVLVLSSQANGQEDTVAPAAVVADVPTGAFAAIPDDASMSVRAFREEVAKSIVQEARKSTKLSNMEKRRIERIMRGGWFNDAKRERIITEVAQKLHAEQVVLVLPDGVQAAVDWDSVLAFIEKLIPLILQLVSLFGG